MTTKRFPKDEQLSLSPTVAETKMLDTMAEMYGSDPTDFRYLHVVLAQNGLPYKEPVLTPERNFYQRKNGQTTMVLTPGVLFNPKTDEAVSVGIPFGAKPRLLLIHLCTQAKIQKSPEIRIGRSMSSFMQDLGLSVTGGKNGSIVRFKEQMNRLAATRMQLLFAQDQKRSLRNPAPVVGTYDLWFPRDPRQAMIWQSTVTLSSEFFASLMDGNALPLDPRAIRGLQQSAMGLDIYTWLAHRLCRIPNNKPASISWFALKGQFGPEFQDMRSFRQEFKRALGTVLNFYREARVEMDHNGIMQLRYSPPPIAKLPIKGN